MKCQLQQKNLRNLTTWNTLENLIPLSQTRKIKVPTEKPKTPNAKVLLKNSTFLKNNERCLNIQPRTQTLKEELHAQHPERQTFKRGKSPQREQNSRSPSQNLSQTNQSDRDKDNHVCKLRLKVQRDRIQIPKVKNKLNYHNFTNQK